MVERLNLESAGDADIWMIDSQGSRYAISVDPFRRNVRYQYSTEPVQKAVDIAARAYFMAYLQASRTPTFPTINSSPAHKVEFVKDGMNGS